jgi:hypothetical protein
MLKNKMETVDQVPQDPVKDVWEYVEDLVQKIMLQHSENFIQVQSSCRRAIQNLMEKTRARCAACQGADRGGAGGDYTADPDYMRTWTAIMRGQKRFMEAVGDKSKPTKVALESLGTWMTEFRPR